MSSHLTVSQTVALLDNLKVTVREFAAHEEKLTREFRTNTHGAERRFAEQSETHDAETAAKISEQDAAYQAARAKLQSKYEQRKARITKAQKSSNRTALARIEQAEGRQKYISQKGLLDTERGRTEGLKRNDAALAEFQGKLAENSAAFVNLERIAERAFRGYSQFRRLLAAPEGVTVPDLSADEYQLFEQLEQLQARTGADLNRFSKLLAPQIFKAVPLWLWIPLLGGASAVLFKAPQYFGISSSTSAHQAAFGVLVLLAAVIAAYFMGKRKAALLARSIAHALEQSRRIHNACVEKSQTRHAQEIERIEREAKERIRMFDDNWGTALEKAEDARKTWPQKMEQKFRRTNQRNDRQYQARVAELERAHAAATDQLKQQSDARKRDVDDTHRAKMDRFKADFDAQWQRMEADWKARIEPIYAAIQSASSTADQEFQQWQPSLWQTWAPPSGFKNAAKFARIEADVKRLAEAVPQDKRLALPGASTISLPLVLRYPQQGSIVFETTKSGNERVFAALNNIIFRLLATSPAGKLSFTIIDPVKLGQNFATVMHLADFEDNLINGRIWTQPNQIDEQLAELNEHMEKVIQMYLRNEYATIAEYNVDAGNIAEKYHIVVIADFPANFTDTAARRLLRIAASGARCGVFTLIHWDHRHAAPPDFLPEELRKTSVCIECEGDRFTLTHPNAGPGKVLLDAPPDPDFATEFLRKVGESSRGSNRVEVPFAQVAPPQPELWSLDTTDEVRVPIGRAGATKLQYLTVGKGTRQHALVAGKTGSGKSTLFHVIITNLALWCSPEQIEFYLVDFKKGVEFKGYAAHRLPHARVVAIESDREFGLSVLQRLDDELKRRGDMFRRLGVQDVAGYKKAGGTEPIPRCLLIIDEFQEFFVEDDRIAQAANVLLDRIVRQGRAFGIHVLLGSQTLGGAYTLARATMGQMVIRIALQCNEADAYLIMDENNAAPRLLTRPGEGIYNDMAGAIEGNSPFQAVWLSDDERDQYLERVRALADQKPNPPPGPIVFEGNAPADVRENAALQALLDAQSIKPAPAARVWLGAPNSIKGPTEAVFQKRSGSNLLVVGQREEAALAILSLSLVALAAQYRRGGAKLFLFESTLPGSSERAFLERIIQAIPHEITIGKAGDLAEITTKLSEELKKRTEDEKAEASPIFLFIHGLQNFKKFRQEDEFSFSSDEGGANPAAQLQKLISDGPSHGIHIIAMLDTFNNVNRFLGRKALSEFEMRVLFQMSTNDSASLCDDPKASTLGLHRALLYNEQEGYLETFRPYALPSTEWIDAGAQKLSRLLGR